MVELIIFDWDDVFTTGSIEGYYRCCQKALEAVGVAVGPIQDARLKETWAESHQAQLAHTLQEHPDLVPDAIRVYEDHWFGDTFVDCLEVVPGAQDFLTAIATRYTLAIASGAHPDVLVNRVFPKFHIPDVFAQVATIYDVGLGHAKPDPYMAYEIMENQGVPPQRTVFVGDAPSDMEMAWRAGIKPIAVLTGHLNRQQAEDLGVEHIVDDVTLIEPELEKFFVT
jgi:phosphoglycolate phosphatase-like HAD superfamily hydrolase